MYISGIDTEGDVTAKSRSDVNIIMSINPVTHQVLLLSTPRDYYVPLSISNGVNPQSPDYLNFNNGRQPLVDAAFLAHGLLRARTQLWDKLDKTTQERVIKELKSSRVIKPSETNWLFFSAMVEAKQRLRMSLKIGIMIISVVLT